ncbi:acetate--CoA ligase family protein [Streptomyces sp. NEAU-YJ-81]|uniref:acetate--CoA ligase family protein n=1 Tax=Streptomyces sp. NEAU-YJ-81 TaxID=2820288 RepID=UPI001ABD2B7D|nr:acetate--CoA ligase family protein [Streptomyces sp. NEAU-YJ-81]MBO3681295.1 acetate--CoA ligase family protein [Streptomyces sp. NEAU-YJ-81]
MDRSLNDMAAGPILSSLLAPRNVVIVGASERSAWSQGSFSNFERLGFEGRVHLVNRNGGTVHGQTAHTSCTELGGPVDLALLLVGARAVPDALRDIAAAGVRSAVVLAAGFSEIGEVGQALQRQVTDLAGELGVTCVGPNCLGFINLVDRVPAWSGRMAELTPGGMAVVSQSGATAHTIAAFAAEQNIGVSHVVSTGNESMVDTTTVAALLIEDERVRSVAMFMESIRDVGMFRSLARRAAELGKPVVALKVGSSELAADIARSHTGALVGDDGLVDAALRQFGIIRVRSLEQLVVTAGLLSRTGPLGPGGLGVVSMSGGACDLVADRAEASGVSLPPLADATRARLAEFLPEFCTLRNPLDATGAASARPELFRDSISAIADDPSIAIVAAIHVLPTDERGESIKERLRIDAPALADSATPAVLVDQTISTIEPATVRSLERLGIPLAMTGLDHFVEAAGHAIRWSQWLRQDRTPTDTAVDVLEVADTDRVWSEAESLDLLVQHGVAAAPYAQVTNEEGAIEAADRMGLPVVVKVVSRDIVHKSDVGGVVLNLGSPEAVRRAYQRVQAAAKAVPGARFEGALVSSMRPTGVEMIVGVVRDEQWGLTLAVGFGGVLVHVMDDTALRPLPVSDNDVRQMLAELRGKALLDGVRGSKPVDQDALVAMILKVARLAERLGDSLESLEINPFRVAESTVEALDASIIWTSQPAAS